MNGNRIAFNEGIEFEHFFIRSDFRPWLTMRALTVPHRIKRFHAMTTGAM